MGSTVLPKIYERLWRGPTRPRCSRRDWRPLRLFDVEQVTGAMREAGLVDVTSNVTGASQIVCGRRAATGT